jgi:hypothetical protein
MSTVKQSMLKEITPGQIKKIHALLAAIGFSDDTYRDILWTRYHVNSSKELGNFLAGRLIEDLEAFAIKKGLWKKSDFKQKYDALNGRPGFASVPQWALIESTWEKVSRMETAELKAKALRSFIFKVAGVSDLRFLNKSGAGKVIIALRAMERKKEQKL